jgi:hypothetical protein
MPGRVSASSTWLDGMPNSFGTSFFGNINFSVYCTYTSSQSDLKEGKISEDEGYEALDDVELDDGLHSFENSSLKLYPNPAKHSVNLKFSSLPSGSTKIHLLDSYGRIIYSELVLNRNTRIDLSGLSAGLYFVRVNNGQDEISRKLIILEE